MAAVRGNTLLIKRGDGASPEVFTTIGALRTGTVSFNGNPIDVTTNDDVDANNEIWRAMITGVKDLAINASGIGKAIEPVQSLYEDFAAGTRRTMQIVVPYVGTWEVTMVFTSIEFSGDYDDVVSFTLGAQSAAAPTFTAET